ncbi:DUF928 domain-containing protein [Tumidithrix elongata RA019]|uniref:DUF928 domain-containing protein n=1 Tax=Tumidithrix elongata BACA0141 TaxID=2716417 RepID=A0AAW9Q5K1_9CYAN|nr:DUF928 domain-containing protein [Tumidithrix elongata RA019]
MLQPQLCTKYPKYSLVASATCITFWLSIAIIASPAIAKPPTSPFGLGLDFFQVSRGISRCPTTIIGNAIAPEDGGRTLSSKPTFYLYVENLEGSQAKSYRAIFFLREGSTVQSKIAYRVVGNSKKLGLLKFTLPDDAPGLPMGTDMRWQVRLELPYNNEININSFVRLEQNAEVTRAIRQASSNLEKARIYAHYYYWYDAFDAYSQWLEANPSDRTARQERSAMMLASQVATSSEKIKCTLVSDIPIDRIESKKPELLLSP